MRLCVFCNKEIHGLNETHETVCRAWQEYERALARDRESLKRLSGANRESERITAEDLAIIVY